LHRTLACNDCHRAGNYGAITAECVGCHRDDALRAGNTGGVNHPAQIACSSCHNPNPNTWSPAQANAAYGRESICR
jgi:hypothetical protein